MATVDLTQAADLIFKHGAKAILLVWVFMLQMQVSEIQTDYKDCMNDRIIDNQRTRGYRLSSVAILPKEVRGKRNRWEDEQGK